MKYSIKILTIDKKNFNNINTLLKAFSSGFKCIVLPTKKKKFVFLKSPHVNKKSKEHFKLFRYSRMYFVNFNSIEDIKYFLLYLPENIHITFHKKTIL